MKDRVEGGGSSNGGGSSSMAEVEVSSIVDGRGSSMTEEDDYWKASITLVADL
jgi:hypothetical protein